MSAPQPADAPQESRDNAPAIKAQMAEVAADLFAEKGFAATSIREICEAVGVTKPTLYYHFGSKDGLIRHIVFSIMDEFVGDIDELPTSASLEDALCRLAQQNFQFARERPAFVKLLGRLDIMPPPEALQGDLELVQMRTLKKLVEVFERGRDAGEIPDVDLEFCTMTFFSLLHFQVNARLKHADFFIRSDEDAARDLVRFLLAGARGAPPPGSTCAWPDLTLAPPTCPPDDDSS